LMEMMFLCFKKAHGACKNQCKNIPLISVQNRS
jgi:hypothetical protein